jgi:AcrR family transcriptional regulator
MSHERIAQKLRTRAALLEATRALVARGEAVTVAAAAKAAKISKATAYRYFSDPAVLVAEAGLDVEVQPYQTVVRDQPDPRGRLRAITLYFFDLAMANEAGFRAYLGGWLTAWGSGTARPTRGARRVAMYRRALEDTALGPAERDALVRALTPATGSEAMIGLLDIAGASRDEARQTVAEIAEAVLDRYFGPG